MTTRKNYPTSHVQPRVEILGGTVTIGASGAISDQTGAKMSGGTVMQAESEDGRYTIAFYRTFKRILTASVNMVGPADGAFPTTTGSDPQIRNLAASGFDIQTKRTDTQADADPASGSKLVWTAIVSHL